jgi:four helix bundle protein
VTSKSFEDLIVWQRAHELVLAIYRLSAGFPREELFGLTSQLRRAAVSVPSNIAEGFKRAGKSDKLRFYNTAQASLEECRYQLILARDLKYGDPGEHFACLEEVSRLLDAYMKSLQRSWRASPAYWLLLAGTWLFPTTY